MTRKQRRRISEFIRGYRAGYTFHPLHPSKLVGLSSDFLRGYYTARRDHKDHEQPLY